MDTFHRFVLAVSGVQVMWVGLCYLFVPNWFYGTFFDMTVTSVEEYNVLRASAGGVFLAFASFFFLGAFKRSFRRFGTQALLTYMAGLLSGRFLSMVVDGLPNESLMAVTLIECIDLVCILIVINHKGWKNLNAPDHY